MSNLSHFKLEMAEPQEHLELREAVERGAIHLSAEARHRAVQFFVNQGWTGRPNAAKCVELAGQFEAQARASNDDRGAAVLPETPLSTYAGEEWVRILTPRIEEEREFIWGTPAAPWNPEQWNEGVQWLLAEEKRGREALGIPAGRRETEEATELWLQLEEPATRLEEITGWDVTLRVRTRSVQLLRPSNKEWEITSVEAFGSKAIRRIERLCDEVSAVTGFQTQDVTAWVLYGIAPVFMRAYVKEWRHAHIRLPGPHREPDPPDPGINLARSFTVSVTFRTPDVTQDDLGTLRDAVRHAWQRAGGLDPSDRHRLTDAGRALLRAWREAGGPEGRGGRGFWEEVRQGWQALAAADERIPAPPSKVESVRRYWYLLEKKRESGLLNHIPSTTSNSDPGEKR